MSELRFCIVSSHPKVSSGRLVDKTLDDVAALDTYLRGKYPEMVDVSIEAEREKSIPIDPVTAYLVLKFVGAAVSGGFLKKLGEDAYDFLKDRLSNGSIDPPEEKR